MKLTKLITAATPGPWKQNFGGHIDPQGKEVYQEDVEGAFQTLFISLRHEDAELICHLVNNASKYAELVEAGKKVIDLSAPYQNESGVIEVPLHIYGGLIRTLEALENEDGS